MAGRLPGLLAAGLAAAILGSGALAPAPALAQSCSGKLVPVAGAASDTSYSFGCDFTIGRYEFKATDLNGEPVSGSVHGAGQGFGCAMGTNPDTEELDPSDWVCNGGSGATVDGFFTLTPSARGGSVDPCAQHLMLTVTSSIGGRNKGTRFSLNIDCSGGGGGTGAPAISALRLSPSTFKAASKGSSVATAVGTKVSYKLSTAARTTFTVEHAVTGIKSGRRCVAPTRRTRNGKHCTRYVKVHGSFTHSGKAGTNGFRFTGRLSGRKLVPGAYRVAATARTSAGRTGATVRSSQFHIKR